MMTYYDNTNLIKGSKAEVLRYQIMVIQTDNFFVSEVDKASVIEEISKGMNNGLVFLPPGFSIKTVDRDKIVELR